MTCENFHLWLTKFDKRMSLENRNVLLFVDNAAGHNADNLIGKLSNVTVQFSPPNTTSFLHSMDAGIIRNLKLNYRKIFISSLIDSVEATKKIELPSIKEAINMIKKAWSFGKTRKY